MVFGRILLTAGTGLTVALVVGVIVTAILEPYIAFSVFIGIPAGALGGVIGAAIAYRELDSYATRTTRAFLTGLTAFGFVVISLFVIRIVISDTRQLLTTTTILAISVVVALGAVAAVMLVNDTHRPDQARSSR